MQVPATTPFHCNLRWTTSLKARNFRFHSFLIRPMTHGVSLHVQHVLVGARKHRTAIPHHEPLAIATLLRLNTDESGNVDFNSAGASSGADPLLRLKMRQLVEMVAKVSDTAIPAGADLSRET